jgi:hypothetical protein
MQSWAEVNIVLKFLPPFSCRFLFTVSRGYRSNDMDTELTKETPITLHITPANPLSF